VDFWAQHKSFVLKVLAGVVVFCVALIARRITYGDELEKAATTNGQLAAKLRRMSIAPLSQIQALEDSTTELRKHAGTILDQVGWNAADEQGLQVELLRRILGYLRSYREADAAGIDRAVEQMRQAIRDDLNGGFGQLRLRVRDDLVDEASERNITITPGIGFENVLEVQASELTKYLLQLELVARLLRSCIDERVDAVVEIRLREPREGEAIPGANPEYLREAFVDIALRARQDVLTRVLDGLDRGKRVPMRGLRIDRLPRPADHVGAELTLVVLAVNPEVPFALKEERS